MSNRELIERLNDCARRIGKMCAERRGPRMTIPVQPDDDDVFITNTVRQAATALSAMEGEAGAKPVAWRVKNDASEWVSTTNRALAATWRDFEHLAVEPLFAHPAPLTPDERGEVVAIFGPLVRAAFGLAQGVDWNKGNHAILHGNRANLIHALPDARSLLNKLERG